VLMSALGQKQTWRREISMSALLAEAHHPEDGAVLSEN
jgi:hypothetical protein